MRFRIWNVLREHLGLTLKCGSVLFLFLISVLVVACGANNTAQVPGDPPVTVTINLNQVLASPTPPLAPYACGAWATVATPIYSPTGTEQVYAKFVQNVDGNPVGMNGARATATAYWPSDPPTTISEVTTSDGLAVFSFTLQPSSVNRVVRVEVNFTSADGLHTCSVTRDQNNAAFFTAIQVSPTASPGASPTPGTTPPSGPPGICPTGVPSFLNPCNTPGPRRTPGGGGN